MMELCPPISCRASSRFGGPKNRKARQQAGNRLLAPENGDVHGSRKVYQVMAAFNFKWWLEGTELPRYLDLDASLTKFQELVNEALSRELLDVKTVPVTLMLARSISFHGQLAAELPPQAAMLIRSIWEEGYCQVFESEKGSGKDR
jgi:hypothetical protein